MTEGEPVPIPRAELEAEAERCRLVLDMEPPDDMSDMLYAAYNALLFALGYGVKPPSQTFRGSLRAFRNPHGEIGSKTDD